MGRYEEKTPKIAPEQLSVAGIRGQLVALKCDLQHFAAVGSSALLTESIRDRIRQLEAQLLQMRASATRPAALPVEIDSGPTVYATTAARFTPRPRRSL